MNFNIKTTANPEVAAGFLAERILEQLKDGKKVLWLVPGGSAIAVATLAAKIISEHPHSNLIVTLTDERYGAVGHTDSNWQQLMDKGFSLPQAKLLPVLEGSDRTMTTKKFNTIIEAGFKEALYKIGLFGVGSDGHTAGILPESKAVDSLDWVCGYDTPQFVRITITPKAITELDEAVVFAQGKEKWPVIESLEKEINANLQPVQILKKVPRLTIFTDKK